MNNLINKKTYQIFIFSFIFIILSLFNINKTSADYYYWVDSIHTGESGFDTKKDCEERLKMVHPSHKTSGSCYESKEVASITSFSPTTGKPYDTITITGKNLRTIKSIYFNNQISTFDGKTSGSSTEIKVTVPNGATTGPIIINTEFRGIAKSKTNFIINDTDLYWWYLNSTGQIRGVDGHHSLNGFKDKNSCEEAKSEYIKTINSMSLKLSDCFQRTTKEISEQIKNENKDPVVDVSPGNSPLSTAVSPIYKLLAPIGSLTQIETNNIGSYFNTLFKIAIGLCAALAVIMIIIYGIMHMGSDSVFGKVEAMGKIQNALLGLLLAIGSYVLLNTIDPSLTGSGGVNVSQAEIDIESTPWEIYEKGDNTKDCPEGFVDVSVQYPDNTKGDPTPINVCKSISNNLVYMINQAYRESGIKLSGYGSRTIKKQEQLRSQNCGGSSNIYNKKAKCNPPTAVPGNSNHEKGLAVDFRCNGLRMPKNDVNNVCYQWLRKNAEKYGFKNDYNKLKETWHWSKTGL